MRSAPPVVLAALLALPAHAAETVIPLSGDVPDDGLDHFFVPFEVPAGVAEIEVRHADGSDVNILDWGLDGPEGFVGWGGGNTEPAVVGAQASSRSYRLSDLPAGTWQVVVGKAKIIDPPGHYDIEVVLRDASTLAPQPERTPYQPAAPLESGARWYAGDPHVHSRESGDAGPTIDTVAAYAASVGLDWVVLSEHNTTSQDDFLADVQARSPTVLLLPGIEYTTYQGHAGAPGVTAWVDHRVGQPGATIEGAADEIHAQGGVLIVNHPTLDLGDACIGCAWEHDLDPAQIDGVEVITGGWAPVGQLFYPSAVELWESWLDRGARVAAIGGSDDHQAGAGGGVTYSPIGSPTTMVWAEELSHDGLLAGFRSGLTVVKLQGPDDPMVELWPDASAGVPDPTAQELPDSAPLVATVTGGLGATLQWVVDGVLDQSVAVDADPFTASRTFDAGDDGVRVRLVLQVDGADRVVTSYRWLVHAEGGPGDSGEGGGGDPGCGCAARGGAGSTGEAGESGAGALVAVALVVAAGRRRRPPHPHQLGSNA